MTKHKILLTLRTADETYTDRYINPTTEKCVLCGQFITDYLKLPLHRKITVHASVIRPHEKGWRTVPLRWNDYWRSYYLNVEGDEFPNIGKSLTREASDMVQAMASAANIFAANLSRIYIKIEPTK